MGVKLEGQSQSSLVMKTLTHSRQFSKHAPTFASSTGSRLKPLGSGRGQSPAKGGGRGMGRAFASNLPSLGSSGPRRRRAPARGLQGPLWHHEPRTVAALRVPLNNNKTSNFEIFFVFRCSKPGFQQRKWKRETKRAFPRPPLSLSLVSICNTLFLQQAQTTRKAENKIWIFPSFFTVNLSKNNEKNSGLY